jgi:AcrR family transcriptional regulator
VSGVAVRRANPRGQGDRLRQQLLATATVSIEASGARQLTLRALARQVGITPPSVYLHFPSLDHLLAAVVQQAFADLTEATSAAARTVADPAEELRARCRAYCRFALEHPHLYQLMFQEDLPLTFASNPDSTPGRRSFDNLVSAVRRCLAADVCPPDNDPFRLASLIWAAEHGLVLARISRPSFPWADIDGLVDEMVTRMMDLRSTPASRESKRRLRPGRGSVPERCRYGPVRRGQADADAQPR